jgi:hypothetical protein
MATPITDAHCCFPGGDAWSREARRLCSLAAELGIVLDETLLAYGDVRDLQAYRYALERQHIGGSRRRLAWPSAPSPRHHIPAARI